MVLLRYAIAALSLILFSRSSLCSQTFSWVKLGGGGVISGFPYDVAADDDGNVYTAGVLNDAARFGDVVLEKGGFLVKYSGQGEVMWGRRLEGEIKQVLVDEATELIYALGKVSLACFDLNGQIKWAKGLREGTAYHSMQRDGDDGLYVTGSLKDSAYICRVDAAGTLLWERSFLWAKSRDGIANYWEGRASTVDAQGNIYVLIGQSDIGMDMAVVKLDRSGELQWEKRGIGYLGATGIRSDGEGGLIVMVRFNEGATFGDTLFSLPEKGGYGIFRLDAASGEFAGPVTYCFVPGMIYDVSMDDQGNFLYIGQGEQAVQIGPHTLPLTGQEAFIIKLNADLEPSQMRGVDAWTQGRAVFSRGSDIYIAGIVRSDADKLGGLPLGPHGTDIYTAKLDGTLSVSDRSSVDRSSSAVVAPTLIHTSARLRADQDRIDRVMIYSPDGRLVKSYNESVPGAVGMEISLEEFASGLYYVHVQGGEGSSIVKVIKL